MLLRPHFHLPLKFIFGVLCIALAVYARPGTLNDYGKQRRSPSNYGMDTEVVEHDYAAAPAATHRKPAADVASETGRQYNLRSGNGQAGQSAHSFPSSTDRRPSNAHSGHGIGTGAQPSYTDAVLTKAAEVKGTFLCGKVPAEGVVVRLYRTPNEIIENLLAVVKSGSDGSFRIDGHTGTGDGEAAKEFKPHLKIFHRCDDAEKTKGQRTWAFTIEDPSYVTLGRVSRKTFELGTINLELAYPAEKRDLKFVDEQPLGGTAPV